MKTSNWKKTWKNWRGTAGKINFENMPQGQQNVYGKTKEITYFLMELPAWDS